MTQAEEKPDIPYSQEAFIRSYSRRHDLAKLLVQRGESSSQYAQPGYKEARGARFVFSQTTGRCVRQFYEAVQVAGNSLNIDEILSGDIEIMLVWKSPPVYAVVDSFLFKAKEFGGLKRFQGGVDTKGNPVGGYYDVPLEEREGCLDMIDAWVKATFIELI